MDNQLEPITLNTFNKKLENDIAECRFFEQFFECDCSFLDTCLDFTDLYLDLENVCPDGAAHIKQRIKQYYTDCLNNRSKDIPLHKIDPLVFDNPQKLKLELIEAKDFATRLLNIARETSSAMQRYPELLYTLHTLREKGVPTADIDSALENIDSDISVAIHSQHFYLVPRNLWILLYTLNFYRIKVQKLEHWIYQKAGETTIIINQQTFPDQFKDQMMKVVEKALDKHDKKQRGPVRKAGAGKKPTFDTLDLQCKEFWNLYLQNSTKDPHDYARKILNDPKWNEAKYKKDNPYLYTPNMTEEAKRTVRKNLIKRFITWCKTNGKGDPFPQK